MLQTKKTSIVDFPGVEGSVQIYISPEAKKYAVAARTLAIKTYKINDKIKDLNKELRIALTKVSQVLNHLSHFTKEYSNLISSFNSSVPFAKYTSAPSIYEGLSAMYQQWEKSNTNTIDLFTSTIERATKYTKHEMRSIDEVH